MPCSINKKNSLTEQNLLSIAQHYNSALWVYNADVIKERISQLKLFDVIRFAQKACSNIHILRLMRNMGVKVDAVSLGEIERALAAGYKPSCDDITFTADIFEEPTLIRVIDMNIPVNAGSIDMLYQLGKLSPGHKIWLRVNPGFGYGNNKKTNTGGENSKHGIWYDDLPLALIAIKRFNLKLIGLHMHIGSGVNYNHLQTVCDAMVNQVIKFGQDLQAISAGGGLSIPYRCDEKSIDTKHYFGLWNTARERIVNYLGHHIKLEIEPGRFLVAESGVLLCQIRAIKKMGNRHFILVNAGFSDLMRPAMYGSYHAISLIAGDKRIINQNKTIDTLVAGPLCESGDIFTQLEGGTIAVRSLPVAAQVGDYIIIHDTGAYGASMSSNYNSRPLIPEVMFETGIPREIRRSQTIQELLSLEELPILSK
ncbi:diaminopimelate decarboxylase [Candidatus Ishikawella capsulata]|uniref:Diaminopimelate decarboxylase n=1 Tax=Candidatus Ishikawaella capsulata Mpkobe TaxID=476281 RepID=C5WCF4_9ENTR|nr:diaminopimelate decarboxylase [Candidatus Ishikawaella capsulata]BAH83010.1 diaminopimelate decarboxylase [Candidatus Ishikawaella capsulata Mpkobe]